MTEQIPTTYVGPLEPFEFTISEQVQGQYLEAMEDHHLRYLITHQGRTPVIHPGILLSYSNATRSPSFGGPNTRWMHLREQTHFSASARLNQVLVADWRVEDHEPWFGRTLARVCCVVTTCDGTRVLERIMWGLRSSAEHPVTAAERQPQRDGVDPAAWRIPGRRKTITIERMKLFSGWKAQNLHTDDAIAKDAGLPAPVASAAHGMGYLSEFMIDNLGEEWLSGGSWVLTFRKPMLPDDQIEAAGRLRNVEPTPGGAQCTLDIRLVNQHGAVITQGSATGHRTDHTLG
jgi:acyl dehydratase